MNVLKPNLRISVQTLLDAGKSQREIERVLGVDRKTTFHLVNVADTCSVWNVLSSVRMGSIGNTGLI